MDRTIQRMIAELNDAVLNGCDTDLLEETISGLKEVNKQLESLEQMTADYDRKLSMVTRHYMEAVENL